MRTLYRTRSCSGLLVMGRGMPLLAMGRGKAPLTTAHSRPRMAVRKRMLHRTIGHGRLLLAMGHSRPPLTTGLEVLLWTMGPCLVRLWLLRVAHLGLAEAHLRLRRIARRLLRWARSEA